MIEILVGFYVGGMTATYMMTSTVEGSTHKARIMFTVFWPAVAVAVVNPVTK